MSSILRHADSLRQESPIMGYIYKAINNELTKIGSAIYTAHKFGNDNVTVKLTYNFNCPKNIKNKDIQTNVYYTIIKELEKKEYTIQLEPKPNKTILLHIFWKVTISNELTSKMEKKIKDVTI
jgi:hypothetical protein